MCKYYTVLLLVLCLAAVSPAFSQSNGIYESYAIISINGGGNAYYDMAASTPNTDFQGANLGTYNYTQSLVVKGGQNKTFKCSGGDITNGAMNWRVWKTSAGAGGGFSSISYGFVSNDAGGCGGNQTWEGTGGTTNVITGLAPGNYTLEVYSTAGGTPNNPAYSNNGGNNYRATFTVTSSPTNPVIVNATTGTAWAEYATLGAAFTAINAGTHTGVITISIDGNTAETGSAALNASGSGSASYSSISIQPTNGAVRTISGNIAGPLVNFNGADNVTVDGLNTGGNGLTISNANTGAFATIQFIGDASSNTITNCTISGSSTGASGTIVFLTGTTTGNISNTISNNNITATGTNLPANAIYSVGTSAAIANTNTVSGNNISDFFSAAAVSCGINIGATGNTGWTISNNKLFQSATRVFTTANTHNGIFIGTGSGYTLTGNSIGFANASGTGTTNLIGNTVTLAGFPSSYTTTGTANATRYIAINCAFTAAGTNSIIQNNTIGGLALYSSSGATTTNGVFCGIAVTSGNATIGGASALNGNNIGATTGTGNIYLAVTTTGGTAVGIYTTSANTITIQNNNIGSIDASGTTATTSGSFTGIDVAGAAIYNIANNNIGNATTDNIRTGYFLTSSNLSNAGTLTSTTGTSAIVGIRSAASGTTLSVTSNNIRGLASSGTVTTVTGITSTGVNTSSQSVTSNFLGTSTLGFIRYAVANAGVFTGISSTNLSAAAGLTISSNEFFGITYTVAGSGSNTYIAWGHAASATDNINSNKFNNLQVNTTGSITFFARGTGNMTASGVENVNNNSIVTAFNKTGVGGTVTLYSANSSSVTGSVMTQTGNNFSNITLTGSTTMAGWNNTEGASSSSSAAKNISANTFTNWTGGSSAIKVIATDYNGSGTSIATNTISNISGTGSIIGIELGSNSGGAEAVQGNTISTLNGTGTAAASVVYGINMLSASITTSNVSANTIYSLSSAAAVAHGAVAIRFNTGLAANIFKNKIYDVNGTGSATTVDGIYIVGGATNSAYNIYNNIIGELKAPAASYSAGTPAVTGIYSNTTATTSTIRLYYNTIYLSGTSSGTNFGGAAVYHVGSATATNGALDLRNNNLVNLITSKGSGLAVALQRSLTSLGNFATTSNNNNLYGTSGLYYDGTTNYATLVTYKAAVTARETSSVSENPTFTSTVGSNANYLHINTGVATQLESGAAAIATYTDDFDGDTRSATTPDIGADEFTGTAVDAIPPTITFTSNPSGNVMCPQPVIATITDASGINNSSGLKPRLYFKKSTEANAFGTYPGDNVAAFNGWKYVETSSASSPYSFTFNFALLNTAIADGNVINYFIAAQDLVSTPNVGTLTAAISGGSPTSVNFSNSLSATAANSFTYTAPPATLNLTAVATNFCVSGSTTVSISSTPVLSNVTYQWEEGPAAAGPFANASGTSTGATYTTPTISTATYYRVRVYCNGVEIAASPSAAVGITVTSPTVVSTTPGSRCGVGTVNLAATGSAGTTLRWYDLATAGTLLGTGTTFTTPSISGNTTYYVSAVTSNPGTAAVGAGGTTGTGFSYNFTNGGYGGMKTQYLFTAAELTSAGLTAGNITNLAFEFTSVGSTLSGLNIQIGTSALSTFNTPVTIVGGLSTVYTAASFTPVIGINNFPITAFNWDGTSSVIISVSWSNNNASNTASTIRYDATTNYMSQSYRKDNETAANMLAFSGSTGAGTFSLDRSQSRAKISFTGQVACASTPRTAVLASIASAPALSIGTNTPIAVCNGAVVMYNVTSAITDYTNYTWTVTNGSLYTDAGTTVAYVAGSNATTVYFVGTTAGTATVTANADNSGTGCVATAVVKTLNVLPSAITAAAGTTNICLSGSTTITLNPSTAATYTNATIQWQSSPDGIGSWNDIASANGVTYTTPTITATSYYRAVVKNSAGTDCLASNVITITVSNPSITGTTPNSRCGIGTVTLGATGSAGTSVGWFAALTGGSQLGTGTSFVTPGISGNTTYYAQAYISGSGNAVIGAGATTSATYPNPLYSNWANQKQQVLILASELTAAGLLPGNITAMSINLTSTSTTARNNFTVNVAHTAATALTTTYLTPTFTQVYTANYTPAVGVNTFTFGTGAGSSGTFNWDGTSNLLLEICWDNAPSTATIASTCTADNTSFVSVVSYNRTSTITTVCGATVTGSNTYSVRPRYTFTGQTISCASSPRTPVLATISTAPTLVIGNTTPIAVCNGAVVMYDVTSPLSDYTNYTWSATNGTLYTNAAATIPYVAGSSATTVYFVGTTAGTATVTANADNSGTGCVATSVVKTLNVLPASISAAAGATSFCLSGSTTLTINPSTAASYTNATIQWQSSPDGIGSWSDIASANGTTYTTPTLTANTYYRVIVKNSANADCLTSNVITITINNPSISATTPATRCGAGTVTLSATGSAGTTLNWYTASSGGSPVFTGSSYSPAVAATTTYYVAASSGGSGINGGRLAPTSTTTYNDGTTGLVFSVTTALTLNSVDVYNNGSAGNMVIRLVNSGGTTLQTSGTFTVPAGAGTTAYTANLGWSIPVGTGYRLIATSATTASLVRESSLGGFPYAIGSVASITGGWFGGASTSYYHFYNWSVSTVCESSRTAVTATVNIPPAISVSGTATICNGSSTNLGVSSTNDPAYTYTWTPGPLSGNAPSVSPATTTKYYVDALDNSGGANQGCTVRDSVTITVLPASVTAAAAAPICVSGSTTITLNPSTSASYTNGTIQWQSSPDGIGSWTDIGSANGVTYTTPTLTANGYYRALVKNSASVNCLTSNVVTVVVNNPTIASFTPASRCGIGTVNLSATGSAGTSLNWYAASTGGAPLGTGNTFTTPSISATTTYYVDASIGSSNVTLGLAANSTSCGTPANATLSDWPLRFNTTTSSTLVSVDVIANSAGSYTFKLRASGSSTDILSTTQTLAAGIQTVTLNWPISSAGSYQITSTTGGLARVSTFTCTFPFTSPSGNVSIISSSNTSTGLNITSYYNCFYNLVFTEGCTSARTAVTATVTPPPALSLTNTAIDICSGTPSDTVRLTSPASSFNNYSWSPAAGVSGNATDGWVFNPSANTTYTLTGTQTSGSQCVNQLAVTVTVKPIPASPVVTPSTPVAICSGASQVLTATATGTITDLINETFQTFSGTTLANGWSSTNTSVGGTVANATWRTRNSPYSYVDTYTGYTWLDFYSNDNSRFMLSNSDHQDGTTTSTTLQMPSFSTVGKVSADLILYHNYIHNEATDSATIEISTNGTAWNPLKIYKTDQGYVTYYGSDFDYDYYDVDMVKDSISLPAPYLNQATVYIRYRYQTGYAFWWAIDNVRVSAADPASIAWTANPAAGAGLPAGAGTPSVANTSIVINPTEPGTILYTASVTGSNGCKGTAVVTANVSANQWVGPNSGGDWNVAANWCGGVPTAASSVEIPATAVVDIKTANALAKNITIQGPGGGIQMLNSYSLIISNNGNLNNAGTLNATASTGAVVFVGNGTVTGTTVFKHVQVGNGGVDFGANSTIGAAGSLTLTSTSGYINNNAPFYDCTATLVYSSGGTFNRWIEWGTASSGKGFPGNVTVTNNTILNYPNGATDARAICGNLTVNAGSSFYMDYGSPDPTAALTIGGNVLLNGNMSLSEAAGGDLKVAGNWERGVAGVLTAHGRAIEFNGTALQTISRTGAGTENSFDYMIVNKASGNLQLRGTPATTSVVLNASAGNVLQLLNGNIDLNGQSLSMNNAGGNILVQGAARTLSGVAGSKFIINGYKTVTANAGGSLVTDVNVAVELNAAINFGPNLSTVNGILQLNAGSYVDINAPYYGNASLLKYNNNGVYERRVEWSGSTPTGTGYPNDVQVTNNTSLQPGGPGAPGSFIATTFNASRNVTIDAGSAIYMDATDKVMTVPLKVGGNLNIAGSLSASSAIGGDVYVSGNWLRTGTFTHNNRAVFFDGSSNGTITATGGQEFAYAYLAKTGATLQLLDDVSITRELGPTSGTLDLAAKNITIRSTATATASVAPVSATLNYGTGRFIIERYISYPRKWQLLSVPAKSTQSIFDSWQDGGSSSSTPTGYGVQVTGPGPIAGTGLDAVSNTPSMKYQVGAATTYTGVTQTNTAGSLPNPKGYYLYVYGNRSATANVNNPTPTTLRTTGRIFVGTTGNADQPAALTQVATALGDNISVGNPLPSAISFVALKAASGNIAFNYKVWDPSQFGTYGSGIYQTIDYATGGVATPGGGAIYNSAGTDYRTIQSGQAFFVQSEAAGTVTVPFEENMKVSGSRLASRGGSTPQENVDPSSVSMISAMMHGADGRLYDGNRVVLDNRYNIQVNDEDAIKVMNDGINFGNTRFGKALAVEARNRLSDNDTIHYHMTNALTGQYQLRFAVQNINEPLMQAILVDRFNNSRTPVSLTDSSFVNISITNDAASRAANRFFLVFKQTGIVPVTFVGISASRQADRSIAVKWQVQNEVNIVRYEVQRSANGVQFNGILQADAMNAGNYGRTDIAPLADDNFYRIKAIGPGGEITYSAIVKVSPDKQAASVAVTPNPVKDKQLAIRFDKQPAGAYAVQLTNALGQMVYKGVINVNVSAEVKTIPLHPKTAAGSYQLSIRNKAGEVVYSETILIE